MIVSAFIDDLARARIGATYNFYRDGERAALCRARLAQYLEERHAARFLLVGEAAGYRGARVSGIPFTSERHLTGTGPAEASATIVRRALAALDAHADVLCWNVVPTHPHRPGQPESNRPPTRAEIAAATPFLAELAKRRRVIAVGRVAHAELGGAYVRHPSHGGAAAFEAGLLQSLRA